MSTLVSHTVGNPDALQKLIANTQRKHPDFEKTIDREIKTFWNDINGIITSHGSSVVEKTSNAVAIPILELLVAQFDMFLKEKEEKGALKSAIKHIKVFEEANIDTITAQIKGLLDAPNDPSTDEKATEIAAIVARACAEGNEHYVLKLKEAIEAEPLKSSQYVWGASGLVAGVVVGAIAMKFFSKE